MADIKNRVKKNAQNQPPEFKLGSLTKKVVTGKTDRDPVHNLNNEEVFRAVINFMDRCNVTLQGVLMAPGVKQIMTNTPFSDLNRTAELIAMQVKIFAKIENVSVDKVIGKVLASIYESEKEE